MPNNNTLSSESECVTLYVYMGVFCGNKTSSRGNVNIPFLCTSTIVFVAPILGTSTYFCGQVFVCFDVFYGHKTSSSENVNAHFCTF